MRRNAVRGLLAIATLVGAGLIMETAEAATNLRLGHAVATVSAYHTGAMKFKEEVESRTNGEVTVAVYPSGQLGSLREMLEGIQMGNLDFAVTTSSLVAPFCPDIYVFDLPSLFDDYSHAYRALDGKLGGHLNAELEKNGIIPLGWFQHGFRNITCSKDIKTVEDIAGKRFRIMPSNILRDIYQTLGADPVPMNWEELFTALQQGTVDGQENPYAEILDARFYEVQKYLVETEHVFSAAVLSMSPLAAEKLTPAQLAAVREAGKAATAVQRATAMGQVETAKKTLVEQHGMQLRTIDKKAMREKVQPVHAKYPQYAKLVEIINSYR